MSYSDEWQQARFNAQMRRAGLTPHADELQSPAEPASVEATTWKPWAQMTTEERRKALEKREEKP